MSCMMYVMVVACCIYECCTMLLNIYVYTTVLLTTTTTVTVTVTIFYLYIKKASVKVL